MIFFTLWQEVATASVESGITTRKVKMRSEPNEQPVYLKPKHYLSLKATTGPKQIRE